MRVVKSTEKQRRFADEYLISGNATQAAISAGYSKRTAKSVGSENLTKPDIRQYIDERLEQLQSEKIANQEEVLEYLSKVMRGEETDQTVVFQGSEYGSTIEDVQVANKDRIRAAELLGKRYSLWTDKVELDGNMDLKVVVDYGDGENEAPNDS